MVLQKRLEASYAVEAAMVMGIVLWTISFLIQSAFNIHDTVTGAMLLQEMVENARHSQGEEDSCEQFAAKGEELGNPRLWLGRYRVSISKKRGKLEGNAQAGKWSLQLEMEESRPEQFLRKHQALLEKWGEGNDKGG